MPETEDNYMHVVNDSGAPMLVMTNIKRDGDQLLVEGQLMGAWPSKMYASPKDVWKMVKMIVKRPSVIGYVLSLPVLIPRQNRKEREN